MKRPSFASLIIAASAALMPLAARAGGNLNAVLESEVVFLDPHSTTATITRTFGFMVYDTLFAMDSKGDIQPQMVDHYTVSDDKLTWQFFLRGGLRFHDGQPVTSTDVVASLRRWGPKDALGRMLMAATGSLEPTGTDSFVLQLKQPFPLVLQTLGKPNAVTPFIVPARLAGDAKITEIVGSGPFIFRPELWRTGDSMVLDRNPAYVPRAEKPDFLAGGKVVKLDRVTLKAITDSNTAVAALSNGEIDYMQYIPFDWIDRLKSNKNIKLMALGGLDQFQGNFRLNSASPPFDDPAVRRVLWKMVDQNSMLEAIGIPPEFHLPVCNSFWMCGTKLESHAGAEVAKYSLDDAKAELKTTKYNGEKVIFLEIGNSNTTQAPTMVLIEAMKKVGFNVDEQVMDWGTVLQRRAKKDGWSLFGVYSNGVDMQSPLTHFYIASNCSEYPGWSCEPRMTPLLAQFVKADTDDQRHQLADQIQALAYENTPSVMWGQFTVPAGYRSTLHGMIQSSFPMFWEVDKDAK